MYKYRYEKEGSATNCFPENTDKTLWIRSNGTSVADLVLAARNKWPDVELEDIEITSEHHHQYCIYYDLHDASDYVDYLVLNIE